MSLPFSWPLLLAVSFAASFAISFAVARQTRPAPLPLIVAHRGASFDAPENTLAAFKLAWDQEADAIEGDFSLTADGAIVCSHDLTLKRCGNVDRKIIDMTLAEVRAVDVGSWKDPSFAGERVPTLAEVLAVVPAGKRFFMEMKSGPEIVPELLRTIDASKVPLDRLRVIAFDAEVIAAVKRARPELKAYWLTSFKAADGQTTKHPTIDEVLTTLERIHADGLDAKADFSVIDAPFAQRLRDAGHELHLWTVDDAQIAHLAAAIGVDSLTTNRPRLLRSALITR